MKHSDSISLLHVYFTHCVTGKTPFRVRPPPVVRPTVLIGPPGSRPTFLGEIKVDRSQQPLFPTLTRRHVLQADLGLEFHPRL
jgi:hypothetical protein